MKGHWHFRDTWGQEGQRPQASGACGAYLLPVNGALGRFLRLALLTRASRGRARAAHGRSRLWLGRFWLWHLAAEEGGHLILMDRVRVICIEHAPQSLWHNRGSKDE